MPFMTQYTLCKVPIRTGLAFEICFNEIKMWLGGGGGNDENLVYGQETNLIRWKVDLFYIRGLAFFLAPKSVVFLFLPLLQIGNVLQL